MTRRRWDYFVRYLAGDIPPKEYQMKPYSAIQAALARRAQRRRSRLTRTSQ